LTDVPVSRLLVTKMFWETGKHSCASGARLLARLQMRARVAKTVADSIDLFGDSNYGTGNPPAGIARGLALEIVGHGVHNDRTADDGVWTAQLHQLVFHIHNCLAVVVSLQVAQVAHVAVFIVRSAMRLLVGIEVAARRHAVRGATIAEFVDMERVLAWSQPGDLTADGHIIVMLRKGNRSFDAAAAQSMQHRNRLSRTLVRSRLVCCGAPQEEDKYE